VISEREKLDRLRQALADLPPIDPGSAQAPWQRAIRGLLRLEIHERAYAISDQSTVREIEESEPV
jgi:hypothetical protein